MENVHQALVNKFGSIGSDLPHLSYEKIGKYLDLENHKDISVSLGNLPDAYDNSILAGRIYVQYGFPDMVYTVQDYIRKLGHRLLPKVRDFFLQHKDIINQETENRRGNDLKVDWLSGATLTDLYLLRPMSGKSPVESIQFLWMRIAVQLYHAVDIKEVIRCYRELSDRLYIHATPTNFNSGTCEYIRQIQYGRVTRNRTIESYEEYLKYQNACRIRPKNQMSSCFLLNCADSFDGINDAMKTVANISRHNGASGVNITNIRCHSKIGLNGHTKGIVPLMKMFDANINKFNQRGFRPGAANVFMRTHHIDLIPFCKSTLKSGDHNARVHNLNTTIWSSWLFWDRVSKNQMWTLFCPSDTPELEGLYGTEFKDQYEKYEEMIIDNPNFKGRYYRISAADMLLDIVKCQIGSGMPYIMNADSVNIKSNHRHYGPINNSNLCLEICQYSDDNEIASCNLASISAKAFVKQKKINHTTLNLKKDYDWTHFGNTVQNMVKNVNRVMDTNYYFDDKIKKGNRIHRPMGLGVTGFVDALFLMDIYLEHEKATLFNKMFFASFYFNALCQSVAMAITDGPYESFKGSPASEGKLQFDLWAEEYEMMIQNNYLSPTSRIRTRDQDKPLPPSTWGQKEFTLPNGEAIQPTWDSLKDSIIKYGLRNSLLIAPMPSATTATTMLNLENTEGYVTNLYNRRSIVGIFYVHNHYLEKDLREIGVWNNTVLELLRGDSGSISKLPELVLRWKHKFPDFNGDIDRLYYLKEKYKTMWEIKVKNVLFLAADRARYIDQSQSLNIFLKNANTKDVCTILRMAYMLGIKTMIYYLRQGINKGESKNNIVKSRAVNMSVSSSMQSFIDGGDSSSKDTVMYCTKEEGCTACG